MANFEAVARGFDPTVAPEEFGHSDKFAAFPEGVKAEVFDFLVSSTEPCTPEEIAQLLAHLRTLSASRRAMCSTISKFAADGEYLSRAELVPGFAREWRSYQRL
jgi:hypothetical protein